MFKGLFTAIITPFLFDGTLDKVSLCKLIEKQIESNVDGIVVMGTTGESPTISTEEHDEIISFCVQYIDGRCKVIAGTGSNCTHEAIHHSLHAEKAGVDGLLIVNPYYNKPTQKGLYEHFKSIANAVKTPIILYNIEGRTGVNLETSTLLRLAKHPMIVSVKEASGNIAQIKEVIEAVPKGFTVLSGDDGLTMELMQLGGHGAISVLSNILPKEMSNLVKTCEAKSWNQALIIHNNLNNLFQACFIETNPQPIKTLLAHQGECEEIFRLPLTTMEHQNKEALLLVWNNWKHKLTNVR